MHANRKEWSRKTKEWGNQAGRLAKPECVDVLETL